jgi:hypothetical protein
LTLTDKNGNTGAGIYCKLFSFFMSFGQYATQYDGEIKAMNIVLMHLFGRNRSFKKAVIFSDSITGMQFIAKSDALPQVKGNRNSFIH